ncbi:unnamed protein product [Larinioides sclopetarius]|uniref:Uncharacterized protein n=1 Tax=Larinioides sclopetarius TaxID=280406 RepID=A0AAV2ADR7_9ARAC
MFNGCVSMVCAVNSEDNWKAMRIIQIQEHGFIQRKKNQTCLMVM